MTIYTVTIPVSLGGTNVPYNSGTGAYGMASSNGYGYKTYLIPMLSEVIAACAAAVAASGVVGSPLQSANNLSDLTNAATARTNLGVAIGTNVQAYAAPLGYLGALTPAADKGIMFTGAAAAATFDLTAAGRALLDDADASAQRTTLGLGTAATLAAGAVAQTANNLSDLADAATARTNLGLGTAAQLASSAILLKADNLSGIASASAARANLGLGNWLGAYTWATKPASPSAGDVIYVTNIGGGKVFIYNGSRWCALNGEANIATVVSSETGITNTERIFMQALLPAGSWQLNDSIRIHETHAKSGTSDSGNLFVRVGTLGTTGDTAIFSGTTFMATTGRTGGGIFEFKLVSATSVQRVGAAQVSSSHAYLSPSNASPAPAAVAITDSSLNALWISVSLQSSGTTDTLTAYTGQIQLITA